MPTYVSGSGAEYLPDGQYKFTVEMATLKQSKNNSEMIELQLRITDEVLVFDYLVFTAKSAWKIDQFREAIGETVLPGEEVEINPSDLEGKTGQCTLINEAFEGRIRNKVGSYVKAPAQDELSM